MAKKRFDVEVPPGQHLGQSRETGGSYRGHLFDDATGKLVGHAELAEVDEGGEDSATFDYLGDGDTSDSEQPGLLFALGLAGAAFAAVKGAQYIQSRREDKNSARAQGSEAAAAVGQAAIACVATAGWYADASDATRLRYWDGAVWTNRFTPKPGAVPVPAGWYVDAANATRLRYWDGAVWTNRFTPKPGSVPVPVAPAGWYVDATDSTRLRYWNEAVWTNQFTRSRAVAGPASVPLTGNLLGTRVAEEPRIVMSGAEWQELLRAWLKAGAIGEELWRLISNARIQDAGVRILEMQREMESLTAQQGGNRIRLMLEANPSLRDEGALAEFIRLFGGGQNVDHQSAPLRDETVKEISRLTMNREI